MNIYCYSNAYISKIDNKPIGKIVIQSNKDNKIIEITELSWWITKDTLEYNSVVSCLEFIDSLCITEDVNILISNKDVVNNINKEYGNVIITGEYPPDIWHVMSDIMMEINRLNRNYCTNIAINYIDIEDNPTYKICENLDISLAEYMDFPGRIEIVQIKDIVFAVRLKQFWGIEKFYYLIINDKNKIYCCCNQYDLPKNPCIHIKAISIFRGIKEELENLNLRGTQLYPFNKLFQIQQFIENDSKYEL